MRTGDGLIKNFAKLSLDDSELSWWLDKNPRRKLMFLEVARRASKNKNRQFMLSKTEYEKFLLTAEQAGQIERFLDKLLDVGICQLAGSNQESERSKTGIRKPNNRSRVYVLVNNEFIDLSRTQELPKQESEKKETGSNQEGSREESYKTSTRGTTGKEIEQEGNTVPPIPESVTQSTFGPEHTRQLIEDSFKPDSLPKVPQKGFTPIVRSDTLASMIAIGKEFFVEVQWDSYEGEIAEAVAVFGVEQVLSKFRDMCQWVAKNGWQRVRWDKFKMNHLEKLVAKDQLERVKKLPEYAGEKAAALAKRGSNQVNSTFGTDKYQLELMRQSDIAHKFHLWMTSDETELSLELVNAFKTLTDPSAIEQCKKKVAKKKGLPVTEVSI